MIFLYTWKTPNGRKIPIMLEGLGLPYEVRPIDLGKKEQLSSDYLKISPNGKIPAIVDSSVTENGRPLSIFESGAILTYLAEKSGRFLVTSGHARFTALAWLHWQIGGLGPMLGQLGFFAVRSETKDPVAIARFTEEADRLLTVLDHRLSEAPYLAGADYTIADIAAYPWTLAATTFLKEPLAESLKTKTAVKKWLEKVGARPAVVKGMQIPA